MRRIVPLLAVAACPLALLACDDGAAPSSGSATVPVGTLVEATAPPSATASTEAASASTGSVAEPKSTSTERVTTTTVSPTQLVDALADLFGDAPADAPPSDAVVDDTGRMRIEVPESWADRRTSPSPLAEGAEVPSLTAAADQTKFLDGYGAAGLTAVVVDATPADALDAYTFADCGDGGRAPFRSARWTGLYDVWRDCRETAASIVTIAVRPTRGDETVLLLAQVLTPSDLAALDHALATLQLRPA